MPQSINVYVTMQLALLLILTVPVINVIGVRTTVYHDRVIHVHKNGNDSESCLTGQDMRQGNPKNHCCKTMGFIADELRSSGSRNVTIIVETPIIVVKAIAFKNHNDLTIQGRGKDTYLNCRCVKNSSIGILFTDIKGLKLKHFNIMRCCGVHMIDKHWGRASVLIKNCSDVIIMDSRIYNNDLSNGLILLNPSGFITIQHSTFLNNSISKFNKASSTGAGLHIELSRFTRSVTEITISGCNFVRNISPGQKNSINATSLPLNVTKDRIWRRESIGGGMAIVLLSGANATKINVSNCTFMNNSATWGAGLCIYMQRGTHDNTIAISNSTVEKIVHSGEVVAFKLDLEI